MGVLGYLGPDAIDALTDIAQGDDESAAVVAVESLRRIGPEAAPGLAAIWHDAPHAAVRGRADPDFVVVAAAVIVAVRNIRSTRHHAIIG